MKKYSLLFLLSLNFSVVHAMDDQNNFEANRNALAGQMHSIIVKQKEKQLELGAQLVDHKLNLLEQRLLKKRLDQKEAIKKFVTEKFEKVHAAARQLVVVTEDASESMRHRMDQSIDKAQEFLDKFTKMNSQNPTSDSFDERQDRLEKLMKKNLERMQNILATDQEADATLSRIKKLSEDQAKILESLEGKFEGT